ncbi:MAG: Asp-tRNA(Asn)/Glu-tRNA(Gln) amidotransferase subunit GatA [Methanofastidiosum sp.]|jgi:aspartyl-tRNA(Asn)/glutamyl-tRNA(Gln) amidotransferase subunit A|nr:Asp-tRNA(Asn)/Glu-tRNA(Gln) amidotransferase subunit GatA [Methanofastidiosum sp.]
MFTRDLIEDLLSKSVEEHLHNKIEEIDKRNKEINAFITLSTEEAEKSSKEIQKKINDGIQGKLSGLVISIKDNIAVSNTRMTCGSKVLENYIAPYDATVINLIKKEDGIIIGKCNMDEFACGSDGTSSYFGPTKNPRNIDYVPGGSSSGSAASVAADFSDFSIGSDTGGSIRGPASFCGVYGFKPSYGLVSRYGLSDMAMSLEGPGPFAKDTYGIALLLDVISGKDPRDTVTVQSNNSYLKIVENFKDGDIKNMNIAYAKEFFEGVDENIKNMILDKIGMLESQGAKIEEVSLPNIKYSIPIYYLVVFSEFSSAMSKFDGFKYGHYTGGQDIVEAVSNTRETSMGTEVKRRVLLGTFITMEEFKGRWYTKALKARSAIKEDFKRIFNSYDLLIGPTMPTLPWKIGEKISDPLAMYSSDILTASANLAGTCASSQPVGYVKGLPVGLQLHADSLSESKLIKGMRAVEIVCGGM